MCVRCEFMIVRECECVYRVLCVCAPAPIAILSITVVLVITMRLWDTQNKKNQSAAPLTALPQTSLPGQLTHVWLLVSPLPSQPYHRVEVRRRAGLAPLGPSAGVYILPDDTVPAAVRAIALNAHAAVELALHSAGKASAPNVAERERQLRVIRERFAGVGAFDKSE